MAAFWDLNVDYKADTSRDIISNAIKLGYDGIAWNRTIVGKVATSEVNSMTPIPVDEKNVSQSSLLRLQTDGKQFQQKFRLTVEMQAKDHAAQAHSLAATNSALRTYDIIALRPTDEKSWQMACAQIDCDVISLDFSRKVGWYLKLPQIGQAIERGIFFEICYSPSIRDSSARRYLISNSMNLIHMTKGKNIIISSEAQRAMELRGPYDAINLGVLFGLKQERAKLTISSNCRSVLIHAESRRTMKSVMSAVSLSSSVVTPSYPYAPASSSSSSSSVTSVTSSSSLTLLSSASATSSSERDSKQQATPSR